MIFLFCSAMSPDFAGLCSYQSLTASYNSKILLALATITPLVFCEQLEADKLKAYEVDKLRRAEK
jgi:hypothetical protein